MYTLGINAYHADSAAVLMKDGVVLSAFEEERFTRNKHESSFPYRSIQACLDQANITFDSIENIAINTSNKSLRVERALYSIRNLVSPRLILQKIRPLIRTS